MPDIVTIKFTGMEEFAALVDEMKNDFSEKDSKKILNKSIRLAMQPVLALAKQLAPVDTGALQDSLRIEARKPTTKDKRSVYVHNSDIAIGAITTAPANAMVKKGFADYKQKARAIANEFGTAKMAAHPFMRPALEAAGQSAVDILASSFKTVLESYRAKNTK